MDVQLVREEMDRQRQEIRRLRDLVTSMTEELNQRPEAVVITRHHQIVPVDDFLRDQFLHPVRSTSNYLTIEIRYKSYTYRFESAAVISMENYRERS